MTAVARPSAPILVLGFALAGCTGAVTPLACTLDADCDPGSACVAGGCAPSTAICPTLKPTFASIQTGFFKVSCLKATDKATGTLGCHDNDPDSLAASKLDLQTSPYAALLGADGKGAPAAAAQGRPAGLLLVKPGDPSASFLVEKLKIVTFTSELGDGMPPQAPRAVCDGAVAAVSAWIAQGAQGP